MGQNGHSTSATGTGELLEKILDRIGALEDAVARNTAALSKLRRKVGGLRAVLPTKKHLKKLKKLVDQLDAAGDTSNGEERTSGKEPLRN